LKIYISQDSAAMQLKCSVILNNDLIANCSHNVPVKKGRKYSKSANIWWRYGQCQSV